MPGSLFNRARKKRGVQYVGKKVGFIHQFTGALRFRHALVGESHINPPGKEIQLIPERLAMTQNDESVCHGSSVASYGEAFRRAASASLRIAPDSGKTSSS